MKPTLFLSDLHLAPERAAATAAFHAFTRGPARDATAVYILGDLFDAWIGDDQLREPLAAAVAASLRSLADGGVAVFVARGNRDLMLGNVFAQAAGATLLPDELVVDTGTQRLLVLHGDLLCTGDADYQRYRARMHAPGMAQRLLALPYTLRRGIAWYLRRRSGAAKALKAESIMDVEPAAVDAAFRRHGVTRMVHGHTHRPARHALSVDGVARERIVLADWHERGHYLEVSDAGITVRDVAG